MTSRVPQQIEGMEVNNVNQLVSGAIDLTRDDDDVNDTEDDTYGCPLPGFDPNADCALCKLYVRETNIVGPSSGIEPHDDVLDARLLKELISKFHQVKRTSRRALIGAYSDKFRALGRQHPNLAFLVNVTDDQVLRHYEEDHDECAHEFRDTLKEVERTLDTVMREYPKTMCYELRKGPNKGKKVVHQGRLRSYLDTCKVCHQLFPRTNKKK